MLIIELCSITYQNWCALIKNFNLFVDPVVVDDKKNEELTKKEEETKKKEEEEKKSKEKVKPITDLKAGVASILGTSKLVSNPKDRKKRLLEMGRDGFMHAIQKRNRLANPKTPRNRWFRWKDR